MTARIRILIAEDDPDVALLVKTQLDTAGYETLVVGDGPEVLNLAGEFKPHLFLLDIMLPGMSGVQVYRLLQRDPDQRNKSFLFLTGAPEGSISLPQSLWDLILRKPVDRDRLLAKVAELT